MIVLGVWAWGESRRCSSSLVCKTIMHIPLTLFFKVASKEIKALLSVFLVCLMVRDIIQVEIMLCCNGEASGNKQLFTRTCLCVALSRHHRRSYTVFTAMFWWRVLAFSMFVLYTATTALTARAILSPRSPTAIN